MSDTATLDAVQQIMREYFDEDELAITRQTTAQDVEAWDSMNHLNLIIAIEQRFRIKFSNAEVEGLHNVGDLVDTISRKTAGR
jgi:acyl carrier protein